MELVARAFAKLGIDSDTARWPRRHQLRRSSVLPRTAAALGVLALCCGLAACEAADGRKAKPKHSMQDAAAVDSAPADAGERPEADGPTYAYGDWGDPFAGLPSGAEQLARLCETGVEDIVHRLFCGKEPLHIGSLRDLQLAFGLDPDHLGGVSGSALTAHSTSLSLRSVSAISPRAILFKLVVNLLDEVSAPAEFAALAFNRGELFSEIVVMDSAKEYHFYLVRFELECNEHPEGCRPGDLLTESVEHDWRNVTLYDEKALENTVLDCATCHQPDGPDSARILRMQEFDPPWSHWFFNSTEGGRALVGDYAAAKGDERIAGLPREDVGGVSPGGLQLLVSGRDHYQPNPFNSELIEKQVIESAATRGGNQPLDNSVAGDSASWREIYEVAKRGEAIPVPYHDVKVTDPVKLQAMSDAYQAYQRGELAQSELPDLRDIYPDDFKLLAEMGMSSEPGLSGEEVLIQACSQCHNERLNQDLSRARFRANLEGVSQAEKEHAIARMLLPPNDVRHMPPARLRVLSKEARDRAIEALRR